MPAVALELAKKQLRVNDSAEDDLIQQKIDSAVAYVEGLTGKWLTRREEVKQYNCWTKFIALPGPDPEVSGVAYLDADYVETELTDYAQAGARLWPADVWPESGGNIRVTVTAGYEEDAVPADLVEAVLVHVRMAFDELRTGEGGDLAIVANVCRRHLEMTA